MPFNYYLSLSSSSVKPPLDLALASQLLALYWIFSLNRSKAVTILYCRSCDKCQINNEPTRLLLDKALSLPTPDEAYQFIAIDFTDPFNKSNGYTTIMVIIDRFTLYIHLFPLKDEATCKKVFKKSQRTVFNDYGLLLSIVSDQESCFISKFWS